MYNTILFVVYFTDNTFECRAVLYRVLFLRIVLATFCIDWTYSVHRRKMVSEQYNNSSVYVANENPLNRVRVERSYFVNNNNFKTNTHFGYSIWFRPSAILRRVLNEKRIEINIKKNAFFFFFQLRVSYYVYETRVP